MSFSTIEEYKTEIDNKWTEMATLRTELAAIQAVQTIDVDLTKDYDTFKRQAEQVFSQYKSTYDSDVRSKQDEIRAKRNEINNLLDEAKTKLFDDNTVVYNEP